jgi:hypothetical protein
MKKLVVLIASTVALFLVMLAPSSASAGGVSIYVGPPLWLRLPTLRL